MTTCCTRPLHEYSGIAGAGGICTGAALVMMFELRVLTGLHQGAALPLFGEQWCIGAHPEADLALYDPGIAPRHVQLRCSEARWSVQAEEGLVHDANGQAQAQISELALETTFSVGGIQLCVARADTPWPQVFQEPGPTAGTPQEQVTSSMPRWQRRRWICLLLLGAIVVTVLGMTSSDEQHAQASLTLASDQKIELGSSYEVRQQLLKMLSERELGAQVSLQVANGEIVLAGEVSREEVELVTRMLDRFAQHFETTVPVMSRVAERNSDPPFKIVQIIGGPNGHVVLEQGHRLFLGDEVEGLRLVLIDNHKVVFDGQQRYEVLW